jgi:tetratricopeptide (TPR) repeat protein
VYCHIGECFEKLGEYDKALFYYRKSLSLDDIYADSYLGIGMVMDIQGRTAESIAFIEKAISIEPENPDYSLFLVEMLKKLERFDEALEITRSLVTRFPDNEDVWIDHADIHFCKGDLNTALEMIQEGWQKIPNSAVIGYRKVAYLLESGKQLEAEDLLSRLYANEPEGATELAAYYPGIKNNLIYIHLLSGK